MNLGQNYASSNDPNLYRRNVNPNLVGMHTQFMNNSISGNRILQNKNEYENAMVENNVLPHPGLKSTLINKPIKVIATFKNISDDTNFTITFDQTIKDIVSIKLLNGFYIQQASGSSTTPRFIAVIIDEIKKNRGYANTITDVFNNSFATLDYDGTNDIVTDTGATTFNSYRNLFSTHNDIEYFDPPLNGLNKFTIKLKGGHSSITSHAKHQGKLEFLIETKEKLRVY